MDTIKFANGAVYPCSFCAARSGENAIIAVSGIGFSEAAELFSNEEATERIVYGKKAMVGYTRLVSLTVKSYGNQACLSGGHIENITE